ncbi:hypothetical protein BJ875DRAFT_471468 [Amylocarpus encephaloides]|uniref:DUF1330 domain-containing protein n=1 Tax=Amylocarpus encephaloides TaxID=45428 RepID=A0A9P7YCI0_9HELO|nr:hypothetical protein BJ875DRAFT_471468 [Amylocarpus encephaloides]
MPACAIHLLALSCSIPQFLSALRQTELKPLTIAKVIRWIILPSSISTSELLAKNIRWDILLTLPNTSPLPFALASNISHQFTIHGGVPSRLLSSFAEKNQALLHPTTPPPKLTGSLSNPLFSPSSQDLTLSPELHEWISGFGKQEGSGAVSMLNLLAFKPGMHGEYLKYGKAFSESIGSSRGGEAKMVGTVIREPRGDDGWDEVALAHYPSIYHFADMLASEDYQVVNQKHRVPSLRDTCIMCTSELALEDGNDKAKL